jgi:hypothetical protein
MALGLKRSLHACLFQLAGQLVAQSALGSNESSAQALFEAGRSAMAQADYRQACVKFGESQRLDPAVGTLLNLATCEEKQGHLSSAWNLWKAAEAELAPGDKRASFVQAELQRLEVRLPRVVYRIEDPPNDTEVEADGVTLLRGSLGAALPVDPGEHLVKVTAPGRTTWFTRYSITETERKTILLQLGPRLALEGAERSTQEVAGFWFLGVGAAGLLAAGTTGVLAANAKATYDDHCVNANCDARGESAAKRGRALVLVNVVAWVATLASATTGGYLVLTAPRHIEDRRTSWHLVPTGDGIGVQTGF